MKQLLFILFIIFLFSCSENQGKPHNNSTSKALDMIITDKKDNDQINTTDTLQNKYKIFPIDESGSDLSLVKFISDLKKTVINRDTTALFKTFDSEIVTSHGGGIIGKEEFSKNWKLDNPMQSDLWETLSRILKLGGTWEKDEGIYFCIPYTQSNKAFNMFNYDFDWYFTAVCISPKVTVYKEPNLLSQKVSVLNYDIVEMDNDFSSSDFDKINTIDKKVQGYVKSSDLIYTASHQLNLKKIAGEWKIMAFAPFD